MVQLLRSCIVAIVITVLIPLGCAKQESAETEASETVDVGHDEGEEEGGEMVPKDASFMSIRRGAHLMLSYDADLDVFSGTVTNDSEETLCRVRVEVHTDSGTEFGPTPVVDLMAGETVNVTLDAEGIAFEQYTAHPEVSPCSGEGGEHEGEEEGEHGEEGEEH